MSERVFIPSVFYRDPKAALDWLERAFGFEIGLLVTDPEGNIGHAEMSFHGASVGVGGEWGDPTRLGPAVMRSPASLNGAGSQFIRVLLTEGLDAHCQQARDAGGRITQEPENQFYGDRTYRCLDPEGHVWVFSQAIENLTIDQMEAASGLSIKPGKDA